MTVKTSVPRVLMLDGGVPGRQTAGGVMLGDFCRYYPKGYLSWFCFYNSQDRHFMPDPDLISDDLNWVTTVISQRPQQEAIHIPGRLLNRFYLLRYLRSLLAFFWHRYIRWFVVPQLVDQAVKFGRQQGVEIVLAVLNDPVIIYMATKVAATLQVPLVTNVQDPPERFVLDYGLDRFTRRMLLADFAHALQFSLRCSTASEGMQAAYKQQYGVDSGVLMLSVNSNQWQPPARYRQSGEFVIGFAGNLYADQEWTALLEALSSVGWCIGGREIKIRVLSAHLNLRGTNKMHIEYMGWRSVDETLSLLAQTDVDYLPYWSDKDRELFVRQCFPSKLSTYLAAGRPVFYHGPEYASIAGFLQRYPAGYSCYSLEPAQIVDGLKKLITDEQYFVDAVQAGQRALKNELNLEVFLGRFATLLGVNFDQLMPV